MSVAALLLGSCNVLPEPFDMETAELVVPAEAPGSTTRDSKKFEPDTTKFDWVRLKTDEWLKGKILSLREEVFEFDSEEFDKLELEWKKIAGLRSSKSHTILLTQRKSHTGKIRVDNGKLTFLEDPLRQVDRSRLLAIVPDDSSEWNRWSGDISLGTTLRGGNTSETDIAFSASVRREAAATRWDMKYTLDFSEIADIETVNNHRVNSSLDLYLTKSLYVTVLGVTYYKDRFQNIDHRLSPYLAIGYDIVDLSNLDWKVTAGPAYQVTRFVSVQAGEDETNETGAVILGTNFDWDITKVVEFELSYEIVAPVPETHEYNHRMEGKFSIDMRKNFELDISLIWDRNNGQTTSASGVTPDTDDYRMIIALSIDF